MNHCVVDDCGNPGDGLGVGHPSNTEWYCMEHIEVGMARAFAPLTNLDIAWDAHRLN